MASNEAAAVKGIGMIMLGVRDLERSVSFYRDGVGLTVQSQGGGFAFFSGGGVTLSLSEALGRARDYRIGAVEVVFTVDDVRIAHAALRDRGVSFHQAPRVVTGGQWSANFTDPDGHELSIFGPSPGDLASER